MNLRFLFAEVLFNVKNKGRITDFTTFSKDIKRKIVGELNVRRRYVILHV